MPFQGNSHCEVKGLTWRARLQLSLRLTCYICSPSLDLWGSKESGIHARKSLIQWNFEPLSEEPSLHLCLRYQRSSLAKPQLPDDCQCGISAWLYMGTPGSHGPSRTLDFTMTSLKTYSSSTVSAEYILSQLCQSHRHLTSTDFQSMS